MVQAAHKERGGRSHERMRQQDHIRTSLLHQGRRKISKKTSRGNRQAPHTAVRQKMGEQAGAQQAQGRPTNVFETYITAQCVNAGSRLNLAVLNVNTALAECRFRA